MKRARQLGALLLLLVWSLVPAMACTLQDTQMTPAERSCCVQMKQHCGDMDMPCCHKQVRTDSSAVAAKDQHLPQMAAIAHPIILTPILWPALHELQVLPVDVSPPPSPPVPITILRI